LAQNEFRAPADYVVRCSVILALEQVQHGRRHLPLVAGLLAFERSRCWR
jgi:hypothetical protein